ncbi:MAG: NUDIX domain-containing protein, partial [Halobacteria archaeon]
PPSQGKWALPGGIVEQWESTEQAAVREIKEELGIEIEIKRLIGIYNAVARDRNLEYNYDIHCYEANYKNGELKPSSEILDYKWVKSREDIVDLTLTSTARKALEDAGFL